jgi:hypothetical protein
MATKASVEQSTTNVVEADTPNCSEMLLANEMAETESMPASNKASSSLRPYMSKDSQISASAGFTLPWLTAQLLIASAQLETRTFQETTDAQEA